jgi:hypothetical protein
MSSIRDVFYFFLLRKGIFLTVLKGDITWQTACGLFALSFFSNCGEYGAIKARQAKKLYLFSQDKNKKRVQKLN